MEKKINSPVFVGILISLVLIVVSIVSYFTGMYKQSWMQWVGYAILAIGIYWSVANHGKERDSQVTFGNLFAFGFKVAAVVTCLIILYTILSGFLFPEIKEKIIELSREKALQRPGATEDQVDQGMKIFENHYTLFIVIGIIFFYLLLGAIISLLAAAITKKKPQSPFETQP